MVSPAYSVVKINPCVIANMPHGAVAALVGMECFAALDRIGAGPGVLGRLAGFASLLDGGVCMPWRIVLDLAVAGCINASLL